MCQLQQGIGYNGRHKMRSIYLGDLQRNQGYQAVLWLCETYGSGQGRWSIRDLSYVEFVNDRDADLFLLRWA